jgi:hypothetical protein
VLQQSKAPKVEIGLHCNSPYPCDFKGTCWKNVNPAAVIYLNGVEQEQLTKWSEEGIHLVSDIKNTDGIKDNIRLQLEAIQKGEPIINKEKIKAFVASLKFPLTFFDIEAAMPAVPRFVGTGPYHSLPGIFSFVTLNEKGQQKDFCWMHEGHSDPREPFIKAFIEQIPHEGDLLVYDALSEQNILMKLINDFPKYEASLKAITERIKDLALPFAERWYYHPEFRGGYSLKLVSRILFKDNLYAHTAIASGAEAMIVYENLAQTNHLFEYAQMLENLKEYSLADVKMLVEIFHFFRSI